MGLGHGVQGVGSNVGCTLGLGFSAEGACPMARAFGCLWLRVVPACTQGWRRMRIGGRGFTKTAWGVWGT